MSEQKVRVIHKRGGRMITPKASQLAVPSFVTVAKTDKGQVGAEHAKGQITALIRETGAMDAREIAMQLNLDVKLIETLCRELVAAGELSADIVTDTYDCRFSIRSDGDKRWDELFAAMTPEAFARLDAICAESGDDDLPLDFEGR
jgi:hypothetical protein